jgi:hypothetical protein
MKRQRVFLLVVVIILALGLAGCGKKSEINSSAKAQIIGDWYKDGQLTVNRDGVEGPALTFYSDGTCKIASEYGECKWSMDGLQLKVTNYYGEVYTITIQYIGSDGCLILSDNSESTVYWNTAPENDTENIDTSVSDKPTEQYVTLADANSFSEGVAWVTYVDEQGTKQKGLLRTDGTIIRPLSEELMNNSWSDFSSGYSYMSSIYNSPVKYYIINKDCEIVAQSPDDGTDYKIECAGDGLFLIKQTIKDMTTNITKYGVMTADGTWVYNLEEYELFGTHPLSAEYARYDSIKAEFTYIGEGVFCATYRATNVNSTLDQTVLFNVYTKEKFIIHESSHVSSNDDTKIFGNFYNGNTLVKIDGEYYCLTTNFDMSLLDLDVHEVFYYSEGALFGGEEHRGNGGTKLTNAKFYNIDGTLLTDLSQYTLYKSGAYNLYRFTDGYAGVLIKGADDHKYLGIINSNGDFNFEPKKIYMMSIDSELPAISEGSIVYYRQENNKTIGIILNMDGSESQLQQCSVLYNGGTFNDGYILDTKNYVFYDRNSTPLLCKLVA